MSKRLIMKGRKILIYAMVAVIALGGSSSCSSDHVISDPFGGRQDIFIYDGITYQTAGASYYIYEKIGGLYYYSILMGTRGQVDWSKGPEAGEDAGNFVRILLKADTLGKFNGTYDLPFNAMNQVVVSGLPDTLREGKLVLSSNAQNWHFMEVRATTKTNKSLNLRVQLQTGQIAYKLVRTVEGQFTCLSKTYDISFFDTVFKPEQGERILDLGDDDERYVTQIVAFAVETDNELDSSYPSNYGYVSIYDRSVEDRVYYSNFGDGDFKINRNQETYRVEFRLKTLAGDSVKGTYEGRLGY